MNVAIAGGLIIGLIFVAYVIGQTLTFLFGRNLKKQLQEARLRLAQSTSLLVELLDKRLRKAPIVPQITLHNAGPADLVALQEIEASLLKSGQIPPVDLGMERQLLSGRVEFTIARLGKQAVGCCAICRAGLPDQVGFTLVDFFVIPEFQRRGIGSLLLATTLLRCTPATRQSACAALYFEALPPTEQFFSHPELVTWQPEPGENGRHGCMLFDYTITTQLRRLLQSYGAQLPLELPSPAVFENRQR
jgi:GNAT superfamily N-acetyltransferase